MLNTLFPKVRIKTKFAEGNLQLKIGNSIPVVRVLFTLQDAFVGQSEKKSLDDDWYLFRDWNESKISCIKRNLPEPR